MAIVNVDGIKLDTTFIQEYLARPENDPVRLAALKWQEQQAAKTRKRQPKATGGVSVGGVTVPGVQAPSPAVVQPGPIVARAKAKTAAEQKKANDKARAAGVALPYPDAARAEVQQPTTRTGAMGGVPGAGRGGGVTTPARPTGPTTPTGPTGPTIVEPTATATATGPTGAGTGTGAGAGAGRKISKPTTPKEERQVKSEILVSAGINQAVVQYMKENYPEDWAKIKELVDIALASDDPRKSLPRIANAFKNTTYWKNAARENNRTTIGTYFLDNGLDTISNAALIDKLTEDVYVTGVLTEAEAFSQIRKEAVAKLGLTGPDADPSKMKIARDMIDGGQTFLFAAKDYIKFYLGTTGMAEGDFDPFEDSSFLSAFNQSKSLTDFAQKVKSTPSYVNSAIGRQEINSTKLELQRLTRGLGLGYSPQQLEQQAINVASGKETFDQIEYSLRNIAGEAFPAFKDRILAGESITSIASPYVSSMSRILEMPDSAIDLSDPSNEIRKALIGDGKTPKPLWAFEQDLFKDARWQYTSNARETMDRVSMDILQRFGVMG